MSHNDSTWDLSLDISLDIIAVRIYTSTLTLSSQQEDSGRGAP
jgi:hypothetical protein